MRYSAILGLSLKHPFYVDGRCPDFAIEPSAETRRLLRNHRCVLRFQRDGLRVLTALDDAGLAFLPLPEAATFVFHLVLRNSDFALFTDLAAIDGQPAPLFTNVGAGAGAGEELQLGSRSARHSESFVIVQPATEDRFTLSGRPLEDLAPADFEVDSPAAVGGISAYSSVAKEIVLDTDAAQEGDSFTVTYPIRPRLPRGVFAEVEIRPAVGGADEAPVLQEFHVGFQAKRSRWTYYCITDLAADDRVLGIEDAIPAGTEQPLVFGGPRELGDDPDPSDRVAAQLAERYPGIRRVRFISDQLVACRQAPRKHLELRLDGERLSGPLANPSVQNQSWIEIPVADTRQRNDSLFQVVKFLTHPFPKPGE